MLQVNQIRASYGKIEVLRDMTLEIPEGNVVAMLGGNGAGKSTTMKCIVGPVSYTHLTLPTNREV